jgi:hypothetical protein
MIQVEDQQPWGILSAITLLVAIDATAMGLFNRAQKESLCSELFEMKDNTKWLFDMVQDFSQNFLGMQNSCNEM